MSFSQDLKPQVQKNDKDTLFCFTLTQSRILAELITKGEYNQLLLEEVQDQNKKLDELLKVKDTVITYQDKLLKNKDTLITNQETLLEFSKTQTTDLKEQLKKKRRNNVFLTIGLTVISVLAIIR